MARGNRDSAIRGYRGTRHPARRGAEREAELVFRDGMKVLRLVFRGASLIVRYHEAGETGAAFDALRLGAEALAASARRPGPGGGATAALIVDLVEDEVGMMYEARAAERLMRAFRACFPGATLPREGDLRRGRPDGVGPLAKFD
jgi:hypothetical protein